jgi:Family of unknown function (DUF6524)
VPNLVANPPIKPVSLLAKRWLISAAVVFATYNPSGHSYYHWLMRPEGSTPLKAAAGIFLLASATALARMAYVSLGYAGIGAVVAIIFGSILFRIGLGWFGFADVVFTTYTVLLWISTVLGVGLSWSYFQRRLSGEKYVLKSPP